MPLKTLEADITILPVDAIVNAANERMLGGGGVDGFIHRAAGPKLLEACQACPEVTPGVRCPTGQAVITPAFNLPCKFVIHTVGPRWVDGKSNEEALLASAYRNSLNLAKLAKLKSIVFPAISTGIFGFPVALACGIAVRVVREFLVDNPTMEVTLVTFKSPEVTECLRVLGVTA